MALSTQQQQDIGALIEQLRPAEIALDTALAKGAHYRTVRDLRAVCASLERQIDDILAAVSLPRGRRWGTGVSHDLH